MHALRGISLSLDAGELVALVGRSGSGKTTLLNVIGGLDRPDDGHVVVDGQKLGDLDQRGLLRLRRERFGFVFQSFGLLPFLSARENAGVPLRMLRRPAGDRTAARSRPRLAESGHRRHPRPGAGVLRRPRAAPT